MESMEIQMLPREKSTDTADMEAIKNIVNRVYAASEGTLWMNEPVRTTVAEIAEFTENGEIAVAQSNGQIVGCVRVRRIDQETGEFGMLAVDDKCQGSGVGRALIHFAEQKCQKENLRKMQLELLAPLEGTHPDKVILEKWYTRIGYRQVRTETIEASFPELAQLLAIPCKFNIFQKDLS